MALFIPFLGVLIASAIGVALIGILGSIFTFMATGFAKIVLLGGAVFVAFQVYKMQEKREIDSKTALWIIIAVLGLVFLIASGWLPMFSIFQPTMQSIIGLP